MFEDCLVLTIKGVADLALSLEPVIRPRKVPLRKKSVRKTDGSLRGIISVKPKGYWRRIFT